MQARIRAPSRHDRLVCLAVFRLSADPTIVFIFLTIISPALSPKRSASRDTSPAREKDAAMPRVNFRQLSARLSLRPKIDSDPRIVSGIPFSGHFFE
jgi:hypothetical protein